MKESTEVGLDAGTLDGWPSGALLREFKGT